MTKSVNTVAFASFVPALAAEGEGGVWHKILPAGTFKGRDGRGPFTTGDMAAMQAIIDRTLAWWGETEVMVDYDHQSFFGVQPGVGGNAPAAGWMRAFEAREDGIYARIEWTAAAAERIRSNEYRYLSPLFDTDKSGRVTRIDNAALVNQPALDLAAVAAGAARLANPNPDEDHMTLLERLAKALRLDAAKIDEDALVTTVTAFVADRDRLVQAAGLAAGASTDELLTAMSARKGAADPDPSRFVPMSMFAEIRDELTALKVRAVEDKVTEAVDEAIAAGKLPPAEREWALKSARHDLDGFRAFASGMPVLTDRQRGAERPRDAEPDITDADLVAMKALGISREEFVAARKAERS